MIALNLRDSRELAASSERAAQKLDGMVTTERSRADRAEAKYDALCEKLRLQAAKPDDGIIHAKNSGDVRRMFEQSVAADIAKREKEMEN